MSQVGKKRMREEMEKDEKFLDEIEFDLDPKNKIHFKNTLESCFKVFSELEKGGFSDDKDCFAPFRVGQTDFKIDKHDGIFENSIYDAYTYNKDNYENKDKTPKNDICCFSYSLYAKIGKVKKDRGEDKSTLSYLFRYWDKLLDYSISNLLNLVKTCEILQTFFEKKTGEVSKPNFIVRLYANPNIFIPTDELEFFFDFKTARAILKKLFEFPFFEFHQIYIPNFDEKYKIERERFFRFFPLFDRKLNITVSKDMDSVITDFELDNLLVFSKDDTKSLLFYDIYDEINGFDTNTCDEKNKDMWISNKIFMGIYGDEEKETEENRKFSVSCSYQVEHPSWLKDYQVIFYKTILKYKIPAGLFVAKNNTVTFEHFKNTFHMILSNLDLFYSKVFNESFMRTLKKNSERDYKNILRLFGGYEPSNNEIIKFEIGFDEIFLANLFNFIPLENTLQLKSYTNEINKPYYVPPNAYKIEKSITKRGSMYTIKPLVNDYKTLFTSQESNEDAHLIMYTPTTVDRGTSIEESINSFFNKFFF